MLGQEVGQLAEQLLRHTASRVTPTRKGVLSILLAAEAALSHQEIEHLAAQAGYAFDRVTLYRTLDWLVEQGIAHKISSADRIWRFNAKAGLPRQHAHFYCSQCGHIFCLGQLPSLSLDGLPQGYQVHRLEMNLHGLCPACHASG